MSTTARRNKVLGTYHDKIYSRMRLGEQEWRAMGKGGGGMQNVTSKGIWRKPKVINFIIPPATKLGGVYWNHPVRPSVCLSVRL